MTIGAIAKERGLPLHEAMLDVLVEEDLGVTAIAHVMSEKDVRTVLAHPRTMVGTDGLPTRTGKPHPRTYGTYPRVLQHYVGELGLLTLEQAVHRMTGMVARKLGLRDRGVLAPGAAADVVVFDPAHVKDHATYAEPRRSPDGIRPRVRQRRVDRPRRQAHRRTGGHRPIEADRDGLICDHRRFPWRGLRRPPQRSGGATSHARGGHGIRWVGAVCRACLAGGGNPAGHMVPAAGALRGTPASGGRLLHSHAGQGWLSMLQFSAIMCASCWAVPSSHAGTLVSVCR